ncbi:MAG: MBL fold metallo-hydrolase, partial [Synergistaceae bacterium]|nr:MBL fold metallo-hydrolase [Synergistaceae bacterium]
MGKKVFLNTVLLSAAITALLWGFAVEARAANSPTQATIRENEKYMRAPLNYADTRDAVWADRGLIPGSDRVTPRILKDDGTVIWDIGRFSFVRGDIGNPQSFPRTVNPSLWRNGILNNKHGLYEVTSKDFCGESRSIYQVRGFDVANMSFVETANGFIVVDVLMYRESAAAAVKLFYNHIPADKREKKIHTVIISHSHGDHFGGLDGVLDSGMTTPSVEIVVPENFVEAAMSENVTVGPAMLARADSMYGHYLWKYNIPSRQGKVNNGLAIDTPTGGTPIASGNLMITPMTIIKEDNKNNQDFDGTRVKFIMAQNTESPAQMVFFFPDFNSICLAEICNQTQHNVLTPRGAQVRDTVAWYGALNNMLAWIGNDSSPELSAWGPHGWPRWGKDEVREYIEGQRDLYRELHDTTVTLMNQGHGMREAAELFEFPEHVAKQWFNRGYYGATVHNVKAVYQKYLGWFDNNPVNLWRLPGKASAELHAKYLPAGGGLLGAAELAYKDGHYRWVVEVLDHIRLAPEGWPASIRQAALILQADAFEQMAYSAESGIWRNYFLTGAWRNRLFNGKDDFNLENINLSSALLGASKPPTEFTKRENEKYIQELNFNDDEDARRVIRGLLSNDVPPKIRDGTKVIWDMNPYVYISGDIKETEKFPETVNPSLWRNAILNNQYGIYEVTSRDFGNGGPPDVRSIYQVRGFDLANMSFVETENGFIVVDVLSYKESAEYAVDYFYKYLEAEEEGKEEKTIKAVIITHSHVDHFGGIEGVLNHTSADKPIKIYVPEGFTEAAESENVTVGPAMNRRAVWMYGFLPRMIEDNSDLIPERRGQVSNGLAIGSGSGTSFKDLQNLNVIPITKDGLLEDGIDGTSINFILTPHTEAPAEMVFYFPDYNSICLAEICNQCQHNVLTPRGAQVRDTKTWSEALDKILPWVTAGGSDAPELSAWGPHHWPRWGEDDVREYIEGQRNLYKELHDQTVRLMNAGFQTNSVYDMRDAAEQFKFPASISNHWFNRGYYGATVHNVKAVYQKYLGWFNNNPATLWQLPAEKSA